MTLIPISITKTDKNLTIVSGLTGVIVQSTGPKDMERILDFFGIVDMANTTIQKEVSESKWDKFLRKSY